METPVKLTYRERFKRFVNFISPVQLRFERDSAGNKKKRPMLRFVELECWPKNWDGIIKVKYSQTNIWDVACAVMKQRDPKYGKWVVAGADIGEVAYSDKEIRHNAKNANEMKFFFFKYRGGSRIRYGWGLIDRMIVCIDMVILAFLYRSPELQTRSEEHTSELQSP